jgi:hypothetical protein
VPRAAVQKGHFAEKIACPEGCHLTSVHEAAGGTVQKQKELPARFTLFGQDSPVPNVQSGTQVGDLS